MALSLEIRVERFGFECKPAYVKVGSICGNTQFLAVDLWVYASPEARAANAQPLDIMRLDIPTPTGAEPFWPAIYAAIKERPEFAGAVDC